MAIYHKGNRLDGGTSFVPDETLTINAENVLGVTLPTKAVTQAEYDALTEEEKRGKLYVVDEPPWVPVPLSIQEYDTDDGWHVRKWSDGYVEMIYSKDYNVTEWRISDALYMPNNNTGFRTLPRILYPLPLTVLYSQIPSAFADDEGTGVGAMIFNNVDMLTEIGGGYLWSQDPTACRCRFMCSVTGRWK